MCQCSSWFAGSPGEHCTLQLCLHTCILYLDDISLMHILRMHKYKRHWEMKQGSGGGCLNVAKCYCIYTESCISQLQYIVMTRQGHPVLARLVLLGDWCTFLPSDLFLLDLCVLHLGDWCGLLLGGWCGPLPLETGVASFGLSDLLLRD